MTRHGIIQLQASGIPPPATHPHVPTAIADADMRPSGPVPGRQRRAKAQRSGLSASTSALPGSGRAIADIGRRSKSP
jgi:hypothetical protein